jgi:hypothetical protein
MGCSGILKLFLDMLESTVSGKDNDSYFIFLQYKCEDIARCPSANKNYEKFYIVFSIYLFFVSSNCSPMIKNVQYQTGLP